MSLEKRGITPVDTPILSSTEKSKPGPKAKPKVDLEALQDKIHNLEELVIRMAHQSGVSHVIIKKAGLEPYSPVAGDMGKFRKVG